MRRFLGLFLLFTLLSTPVLAQVKAQNLLALLQSHEEFSIFLDLAELTGLTDILANPDISVTVFVPNNDAFSNLPPGMDFEEDLLNNSANSTDLLLYHLSAGAISTTSLSGITELPTLHGNPVSVLASRNNTRFVLGGYAVIEASNLTAANGIAHELSRLLVPQRSSSVQIADLPNLLGANTSSAVAAPVVSEPCTVSARAANTTQVRVGPGENRTSVSFLAANRQFEVQGQTEDNDGNVWYQLDKEEAAPGRSINEAWVDARLVSETGDCSTVVDAAAPPIIPIIQQAPPTNNNSGGTSGGSTGGSTGGGAAQAGLPSNGRYTMGLAEFTNASCTGTGNVTFPTREMGVQMAFGVNVQSNSNSISLDGDVLNNVGGYYQGQWDNFFGDVVTVRVYPQTDRFFTGELIVSFQVQGIWCSGTIAFSASR